MRNEYVGWLECEDGIDLLSDTKFDWHVVLDHSQPIVRCRDCRFWEDGTTNGRRYSEPYCGAIGELAYGALFEVDEDCFCAWASPREEGE